MMMYPVFSHPSRTTNDRIQPFRPKNRAVVHPCSLPHSRIGGSIASNSA